MKARHCGLFLFFATALAMQSEPAGVYRRPVEFEELPGKIRGRLEERGCLIPLSSYGKRNVVRGEFARPGQRDWAILCSDTEKSRILVFWEGPSSCPSELAEQEERSYLDRSGPIERWGYYRSLTAVGKKFILDHYKAYGGPQPPAITHQGINDSFEEKASVVYYCHEGKWLTLSGAD